MATKETGNQAVDKVTTSTADLSTAEALKQRFKQGSVPLESDFADLIDLANTGYTAIGKNREGGQPGNGLMLDADQVLQLKLNEDYSGKDYSPVVFHEDALLVDLGSGLVNKSNSICIGEGNGIKVNTDSISIDPDKILPRGIITMFSGSVIPQGWALCDGKTAGVPDLRHRFILAADNLNESGGYSNTQTADGIIATTTENHSLVKNEIPAHKHWGGIRFHNDKSKNSSDQTTNASINAYQQFRNKPALGSVDYTSGLTEKVIKTGDSWEGTTGYTGGSNDGQDSSAKGHNHKLKVAVPYYKLAFIMKL